MATGVQIRTPASASAANPLKNQRFAGPVPADSRPICFSFASFFATLTLSLRAPQAKASAWDGNHMSMWAPLIDPPMSWTVPEPYPGIQILVPKGQTVGSAAIVPFAATAPEAVTPTFLGVPLRLP